MSFPLQAKSGRIVRGLSNAEYHADKASFSSSFLKKMTLPALALFERENPPPQTPAMALGNGAHTAILEPEKMPELFVTGIDAGRRSKADRTAWADYFSEHGADGESIIELPAAEWNSEFERQTGKRIVTADELQAFTEMYSSVHANPEARALLTDGAAELSLYWTDEETGLPLRIRPDYLNHSAITDLKTCISAADRDVTRAISGLGYGISMAMYRDGVRHVTGEDLPFRFIFVEKTPPYLCRVIELDEEAIFASHRKYRRLLNRLKECLDTGKWPGYSDNLEFAMPEWFLEHSPISFGGSEVML